MSAATESTERVVLTGATGFIGAAILAELLRQRVPTTVLLRPASDPRRLASLAGYRTVTLNSWELAEPPPALQEFQPTVFIHCAWRGVAGDERNQGYQVTENLPCLLGSVGLAQKTGCRQWIGLGSHAEYGHPDHLVDETAPTAPTTIYGQAKLAGGWAARALCATSGLMATWVRIFSTFGPDDQPQWLIPYVIRELFAGASPRLTRCEQRWDYLYVADAAAAIVGLATTHTAGVFNLGSGRAVPLRQIVETLCDLVGNGVKPAYGAVAYRPDQVFHLQADINHLRQATGWEPQTTLEEGLAKTVAFYRAQR